jgi:hypothetical protein
MLSERLAYVVKMTAGNGFGERRAALEKTGKTAPEQRLNDGSGNQ